METVEDLQIGGWKIIQDTEEYRFTSDSVLLARFLKAKKRERVADFCAGSGIVGLHFYAENRGIEQVTLFEMQDKLAQMSRRTIALNGLGDRFFVENIRLQDIPAKYVEQFSLILCNPPYGGGGFCASRVQEAIAKSELTLTVDELCVAASKCLKFGGRFALVYRADRLAELFTALRAHRLEPKKMQLVAGSASSKPYAVLLAAVKGGKPGLDVLRTAVNHKEKV